MIVLPREPVVIYEEFFQFALKVLAQIFHRLDVRPAVRIALDGDDPIISFFHSERPLDPLNHANRPAHECATRKRRFIHEHQYIDWISVVRFGRGNEAEVIGEGHAGRQHFLQLEDAVFRIEGELVPAAFRGFDDYPQVPLVSVRDRF